MKFEAKNYNFLTWWDYYKIACKYTDEEVKNYYCMNEEHEKEMKNTKANYTCEIFLNGEKVANMGYYNFDGMGNWGQLEITNITNNILIKILNDLNFYNDCECQEHTQGEKFMLSNLKYLDKTPLEEIFKKWVNLFNFKKQFYDKKTQ